LAELARAFDTAEQAQEECDKAFDRWSGAFNQSWEQWENTQIANVERAPSEEIVWKRCLPVDQLVATVSGAVGYFIGSAPHLSTVTLEHAQITQIYPAALYVRAANGQEQRYPIDSLDAGWAASLADSQGKRYSLELKLSSQCPNRYTVSTMLADTDVQN
jgi:hypothetical protein